MDDKSLASEINTKKGEIENLEGKVKKETIARLGFGLSWLLGTIGFFYGIFTHAPDWQIYLAGGVAPPSGISSLYFDINLYNSKLRLSNCYYALKKLQFLFDKQQTYQTAH